jgi:RNA polymerase sigma-70 factor, ECF subfamily
MIATAFISSSLIPMETEESQIASGLRRRDPELLDALIEQYQHRLLRYLLHLTGNRAVAEDLFQEVWLRVLEKGHLYDGRNRFVTWLMSIGHNVAIDYLRKRNPRSLDEMQDPEEGAPFEPPSNEPSPFEQAAAHQQQHMFDEALDLVPPLFREVLVLRFQEQMTLEEIAKLIHIPLATVKTRLYRGVQALRPLLRPAARRTGAQQESREGGAL